jgi:uncharacterized RDD family membrane protein YckC
MGVDMAVVIVIGSLIYLGVAVVKLIWSPATFQWPDAPFFLTVVVELTIAVLYLTASWAMTGRTYGDSLLGLRVLSFRRRIPGWALSFVRAVLCVMFPFGLLWVVLSPSRRSIQDVVLRTIVVYDWHAAPVTVTSETAAK